MTDSSLIYRDATFSKKTRDALEGLMGWVGHLDPTATAVKALSDVIDRWDANEATEIVMQEDGTWK